MDPRVKSSLLWGLVAFFAFLVLIQGYELLADETVTIGVKVIVAVLVGAVGTASTYVAYGLLVERRRGQAAQRQTENETS